MGLTDSELRRELEKYGVKIGPINDTTRGLYTKRLEKFVKERKTRPFLAFTTTENQNTKSKRAAARERSASPALRNPINTRSTRKPTQITLGYSTDEDDNAAKETTKSESTANTRSTRQDIRKSFAASKDYESKNLTPVHRRVKTLANSRKSSSSTPKRRSTYSPKPIERYSDDSDDPSERSSTDSWVEMESTETNTTPSLTVNSSRDEARLRKFRAEIEAWKKEEENENDTSCMHGRLSTRHRSAILENFDQNKRTGSRNTLGNGIPSFASKIVTQASEKRRPLLSLVSGSSDAASLQKQPWTLNLSSFLPIGTCIFFIVLGLLYATMKYDPSLNAVPAIDYDSEQNTENATLQIARMIYDHVASYTGERECGTLASEKDLKVSRLLSNLDLLEKDESYMMASKKLIENRDWGVDFYDKENRIITDPEMHHEAEYVNTTLPMLSGWCRFRRAVQKVLLRIVLTTAVGVLLWLALVYRRYRIERQREKREQMYTMVQKILDVLRKQYDMSENNEDIRPFLPILHVRDMIIPPQDRKKMARIWASAKQFLSASETRIRVENQTIQGEDYLVWRWIQATSPAKRHTPTSRVWQGEAFDSKRVPMICPTPCLKIRNVFDPAMEVSKNWIEQIQDSILEKCQGNNEILRICVEKDSKEGLVYILCASNQAAGRAFQALHGTWFDGRLVTVKFIRLHRFHQRFPDSVNQSRTPMCPTSAIPVSTIIAPMPSSNNDTQPYEKLYPTLPGD